MFDAHASNVQLLAGNIPLPWGLDSSCRPTLSTIKNLPSFFPSVGLTVPAIHAQIFKAEDRFNSRGEKIVGNGLAETGAIIRRGRKILIDVSKYSAWLSGTSGSQK